MDTEILTEKTMALFSGLHQVRRKGGADICELADVISGLDMSYSCLVDVAKSSGDDLILGFLEDYVNERDDLVSKVCVTPEQMDVYCSHVKNASYSLQCVPF